MDAEGLPDDLDEVGGKAGGDGIEADSIGGDAGGETTAGNGAVLLDRFFDLVEVFSFWEVDDVVLEGRELLGGRLTGMTYIFVTYLKT